MLTQYFGIKKKLAQKKRIAVNSNRGVSANLRGTEL